MREQSKLAKGRFTGDPSYEFEHTEQKKSEDGEEAGEEETVSVSTNREREGERDVEIHILVHIIDDIQCKVLYLKQVENLSEIKNAILNCYWRT